MSSDTKRRKRRDMVSRHGGEHRLEQGDERGGCLWRASGVLRTMVLPVCWCDENCPKFSAQLGTKEEGGTLR
jgi:hypothetical protein